MEKNEMKEEHQDRFRYTVGREQFPAQQGSATAATTRDDNNPSFINTTIPATKQGESQTQRNQKFSVKTQKKSQQSVSTLALKKQLTNPQITLIFWDFLGRFYNFVATVLLLTSSHFFLTNLNKRVQQEGHQERDIGVSSNNKEEKGKKKTHLNVSRCSFMK